MGSDQLEFIAVATPISMPYHPFDKIFSGRSRRSDIENGAPTADTCPNLAPLPVRAGLDSFARC